MSHISVKHLPKSERWPAYKRAMKAYNKIHGARKFHRTALKKS